jgi:hypothetical protein
MADLGTDLQAHIELDQAVAAFVEASQDGASAVDWWLVCEYADEDTGRQLCFAESPTMTAWKRNGLLRMVANAFGISTHN